MRADLTHVALAGVTMPRDISMLRVWLRRPHVARWWGDPLDALAAIGDHDADSHALITVDDEPVGYVCWQRPPPEELAAVGLDRLPADLIDVDILIGDADLVGRGIGPRALRLVLARLRAEGVSFAGIACAADNLRARRAYEKAGFHPFGTFREAGHDMCYLVQALNAPA